MYPTLFPCLALPLLVFLFWSNEGNKMYLLLMLLTVQWLFSVCKESVSALRTHRRRETISITSTAVFNKKKIGYCFFFLGEHVFNILCFC